jgi:hypothetical protein
VLVFRLSAEEVGEHPTFDEAVDALFNGFQSWVKKEQEQ